MAVLTSLVFHLVDRIAAAGTVAAIWEDYLDAARQVGLGYAAACVMPPASNAPPRIIADALPPGWLEEYEGTNLTEGDLLAVRARAAHTSFEWRMTDWDRATLNPAERRWYDHNIAHDLLGGLIVKDFRRGEDMVMAVCGHDGPIDAHDRLALYFTGQEALLRLRELAAVEPAEILSQRERECLQWMAAGKTDWEIGQILSLSEKTVNVYIERAKAKFGVKSRMQTMVLALQRGLILPAHP